MRLRFMDMEPEEIFQQATQGDERCRNFANLWHRALAGATASSPAGEAREVLHLWST
jgi:glucokinase